MNNPLDLFAWKVRSERKRQHLTQRKLAERLNMNARTIIDLETCQSNPKFETVALVAKELNISVRFANRRKHFKKTNNAAGYINPGRVIFYLFVSMRTDYDIRTMEPPHRIR